jgi:hypothetical protein
VKKLREMVRENWRWLLAFVLTTAVATTFLLFFRASKEHEPAKLRVATEWAAFERCLIGRPLAAGERASVRLRRVVLAAESKTGPESWPQRCEKYRKELSHALTSGGNLDSELLTLYALEQGKLWDEMQWFHADHMFDAAKREIVGTPGDVSGIPTPPEASPLTGLQPIADTLVGADSDRTAGDTVRLSSDDERRVCRLMPGKDVAVVARCTDWHDALPRRYAILSEIVPSVDPADTLLALRYGPHHAIHSVATGAVAWSTEESYREDPQAVAGDGTLTVVHNGKKGLELVRGSAAPIVLDEPTDRSAAGVRLVGSSATWTHTEGARVELYARDVSGEVPGPVVRVGDMPIHNTTEAAACVTREASFLAFGGGTGRWLAARRGDAWSLVEAPEAAGALACAGTTATFTAAEPATKSIEVSHTVCADSCTTHRAIVGVSSNKDYVAAAPVGESVMLVWNALGIRMRVAPVDRLESATDVVLFDSNGLLGTGVHRVVAFPVGRRAAILIETYGPVVGIAVDENGEPSPLPVEEDP